MFAQGTGSRHLVPKRAESGIRRPTRSPTAPSGAPSARPGTATADASSSAARQHALEAPHRSDRARSTAMRSAATARLGDGGGVRQRCDAASELIEGGSDRGELGQLGAARTVGVPWCHHRRSSRSSSRAGARGADTLRRCCSASTCAAAARTFAACCRGPTSPARDPSPRSGRSSRTSGRGGTRRLREYTLRFDRVEHRRDPGARRARSPPRRTPSDPAFSPPSPRRRRSIEAFHRHRPAPLGPSSATASTVDLLELPVARAGVYVPGGLARYPSSVLMTRDPGPRGRRVRASPSCVPPCRDGAIPRRGARGRQPGRGRRGLPRRRGAGDRRHGLRHRDHRPRRRHRRRREPLGLARQAGGPWGRRDAGRLRRALRGRRDRRRDRARSITSAIDLVVQAEHGPDGLAWLITWSEPVLEAVTEAVADFVEQSPRRARDRGDPRRRRLRRARGRAGGRRWRSRTRSRPSTSSCAAPTRGPCSRSCATPARSSSGPTRRPRSATTSPARATSCRRSARPGTRACSAWRTFSAGCTSISADRERLAQVAAHVAAIANAEGLVAHAAVGRAPRRGAERRPRPNEPAPNPMTGRPAPAGPRPEVALRPGYHSPQVEVDVRLNTNESPEPPPAAFVEALAEELRVDLAPPLPRPGGEGPYEPRSPPTTVSSRPRSSAPTARTRPSSASCSPTAGPGDRRCCSSRPTRSTPTSPGSPARRSWPVAATTSSGWILTRSAEVAAATARAIWTHQSRGDVPLLAEQPNRWSRNARERAGAARTRARPRRRRRGLRPVRPVVVARAARDGDPTRRAADVLEDLGHGGTPPRLPHRRPGCRRPRCRTSRFPTISTR